MSPERDFEIEFDKKYDKSEKNYLTHKRRDYSKNNRFMESDRELSAFSRNAAERCSKERTDFSYDRSEILRRIKSS